MPEAVAPMGAVNWIGLYTLAQKEIRRFLKVWMQTLLAPLATALLMLAIFVLALGGQVRTVEGVPFLEFLAPGLAMMLMIQNAFANTSSSLMIAKVQGNIVDLLMPPLRPAELLTGLALGGIARGLLVGLAISLSLSLFVPFGVHDLGVLVLYALLASFCLGLLGLLTAIWAEKFDQLAGITNFIITPLAFLAGTFYSVNSLPEPLHGLAQANPFFYFIDGFRYGLTGHADAPIWRGAVVGLGVAALLWLACLRALARGWRLKG